MPARGTVPDKRVSSPALLRAQVAAFSKQVPVLYLLLSVNALALAYTFWDAAPLWLVAAPSPLLALSAARIVVWVRRRNAAPGSAEAERLLRTTVLLGPAIGMAMLVWALELHQYGSTAQQTHVTVFVGLTVVSCIFCLMHVRTAALGITSSVAIPYSVTLIFSRDPVLMAIGANMALVSLVMIYILFVYSSEFEQMIQAQAETQRLSDDNHRLANIDGLTGLPNRRSFLQTLEGALADAARSGRGLAVVWLDIDSFKAINDTFGHTTGNRVLVGVASRIRELNLPILTMARLEADVFVLILEGITEPAELEAAGQRLCASVREVLELPGASIHITASLGLAAARPDDTAEAIFDRADYVNTVCKRESRGRAVVFAERHEREISKVRALEHALHTAELDREIYVLLQPQFDVALDRTIGFEVLARWRSPVLGEVSPAEFIPLAERLGLVSRITRTVLRKALTVSTQLPRSIRLSVNLSAHDLSSTQAIEDIVAIVTEAGKPCRIDFEITETAVMRDIGQANAALVSLLALGSRISLDDFGTGHSSLTHVQKLPLDRIKIDRSFVSDAPHDPTSRAIVKTMLDLCRNLGIGCVFEGIETEQQLETLLALGGSVMQGYLFGRPMPPEAAIKSLQTEQARRMGAAG